MANFVSIATSCCAEKDLIVSDILSYCFRYSFLLFLIFSLIVGDVYSPGLIYNISEAVSYEVRAHWNANRARNVYDTFMGLSCFSPVINIMRHPLWGRSQVLIDLSHTSMIASKKETCTGINSCRARSF